MLRVLAQRTAPQLARSAVRTTALRGFATFGAVPKKSRFIARYAERRRRARTVVVRRITENLRPPHTEAKALLANHIQQMRLPRRFKRRIPASQRAESAATVAKYLGDVTHHKTRRSFAESHEYAKVDGGVATVGITDYAANALGDIVFVDLPEVGDEVEKGEAFGAVESVKAASDVYAPISGEVVEINGALEDTPDLVNSSALEDGWFIKVKMSDEGEVGSLMDEAAYAEHTKE